MVAAASRLHLLFSALLVAVIVACAVVFGLFLVQHARKSGLEEQAISVRYELDALRTQDGALQDQIKDDGPLVRQIVQKRTLLAELGTEIDAANADVTVMVTKCKEYSQAVQEASEKAVAARGLLTQEVKDRRSELADREKQLYANERDFDGRQKQLNDKIQNLSAKLEAARKKGLKELQGLEARMEELRSRVQELTRQRELSNNQAVQADGKLLEADAAIGFVVVDLGRQQGLRKGTRFSVYNQRGGKNVIKGSIEVVSVGDAVSTCRVLEETNANDPLISNDLISNPVFDRNKIKVYALRGNFAQFSKDELKRFIVESGGRVDDALTVSTDYLVAGDNADGALIQANKLGISVLSEAQLVESRLFRPSAGHQRRN
jgi:hypothetical protein